MSIRVKEALENYFYSMLPHAKKDLIQPSGGWSDEAFIFHLHYEMDGKLHKKGYAVRKQKEA